MQCIYKTLCVQKKWKWCICNKSVLTCKYRRNISLWNNGMAQGTTYLASNILKAKWHIVLISKAINKYRHSASCLQLENLTFVKFKSFSFFSAFLWLKPFATINISVAVFSDCLIIKYEIYPQIISAVYHSLLIFLFT